MLDKINNNILVIGDLMIDVYIKGNVNRVSQEAPVPIVSVDKTIVKAGGAANVAMNINNMGSNPIICSVVGEDTKADDLIDILYTSGISPSHIIKDENRVTTEKTRVVGNNNHQIVRYDKETIGNIDGQTKDKYLREISSIIEYSDIDVILMQDYDKGVITDELIKMVTDMSQDMGIPVVVDPKVKNFNNYKNVKLIKPNLHEFKQGLNIKDISERSIKDGIDLLHSRNIEIVLVTMGGDGMILSYDYGNKYKKIDSIKRNISDVSGAGDTVIAVISSLLNSDNDIQDVVNISNIAGGIVCEYPGVVPINKYELIDNVSRLREKIYLQT